MSDRALVRTLLLLPIAVGLAWIAAGLLGDRSYLDNESASGSYASGDSRAALVRFRTLQRVRPELRELDVNAGVAQVAAGDPARALLDFTSALRSGDARVRAAAFYDRGNALFALGRLDDARVAWTDSLRADPDGRDAKYNIEVVDRLAAGEAGDADADPKPGQSAGPQASPAPGGQSQPGAGGSPRPGAGGSPQPGAGGSPQPGAGSPPPGASGPPSVGQAVIEFRRNLSIDEALRVLDALEAEQHGVQGLLEGTPPRRGTSAPPAY